MNILVKTANAKVITRPDTTWERYNRDAYYPESAKTITFTPVLYAQVERPGCSVARKFAHRYYSAVGYGLLAYPEDFIDGSEEGFACASCLDHTSFLPLPMLKQAFSGAFVLKKDGKELFRYDGPVKDVVEKAIEDITARCLIRNGDLLAVELAPRMPLHSENESPCHITGRCAETTILDFKIL